MLCAAPRLICLRKQARHQTGPDTFPRRCRPPSSLSPQSRGIFGRFSGEYSGPNVCGVYRRGSQSIACCASNQKLVQERSRARGDSTGWSVLPPVYPPAAWGNSDLRERHGRQREPWSFARSGFSGARVSREPKATTECTAISRSDER